MSSPATIAVPTVITLSRTRWRELVSRVPALHVAQRSTAAGTPARLWRSVDGSSNADSGEWSVQFVSAADGARTSLASLGQHADAVLFRVGDVALEPPARLVAVCGRDVIEGKAWSAGLFALAEPPVIAAGTLTPLGPLLRRVGHAPPAPPSLPGGLLRALVVRVGSRAVLAQIHGAGTAPTTTVLEDATRGLRVTLSRVELVVTAPGGAPAELAGTAPRAGGVPRPPGAVAHSVQRVAGAGGLRAAVLPTGALLLGDVDRWWAPAGLPQALPPGAALFAPRQLPQYGALRRTARRGDAPEPNALPEWRLVPVGGAAPLCVLLPSSSAPLDAALGPAAAGVLVTATVTSRDTGAVYAPGAVGAVPRAIMQEALRLDAAASAAAPAGSTPAPHRVLVITGSELALCAAARALLAAGAAVLPLKARMEDPDFCERATVRATCERLRAAKPADVSNDVAAALQAMPRAASNSPPTSALAALAAAGIAPRGPGGAGSHPGVTSWAELGARVAAGAGFVPEVATLFPEPAASYIRVACAIAARPDRTPSVLDEGAHVRASNVKFEEGAIKERAARLVAALYWRSYAEDGAGGAPGDLFAAILLDGLIQYGLVAGTKNAYARGVPEKRVILLDYCFWYGETALGSLTPPPAPVFSPVMFGAAAMKRPADGPEKRSHKRARAAPAPFPDMPPLEATARVPRLAERAQAPAHMEWPVFEFPPSPRQNGTASNVDAADLDAVFPGGALFDFPGVEANI